MTKKNFTWLFYLIDHTLTPDPGDYTAKVKKMRATRTMHDIAQQIIREGTEYQLETIIDILSRANRIKIDFLSLGDSVNDGTAIYEPTITGIFHDPVFDEKYHSCIVNINSTKEVNEMVAQVRGMYSGFTVDNGGAVIEKITDSTSGSTTGEVTPGKIITLSGKKIKLVPEDGNTLESCITFTNVDTEQVITQQDAPAINDPSKLVFQLPMLPAGTYLLTIKTLFSTAGTDLKAPRYITSKIKLVVS